jgi:hypothetical protein
VALFKTWQQSVGTGLGLMVLAFDITVFLVLWNVAILIAGVYLPPMVAWIFSVSVIPLLSTAQLLQIAGPCLCLAVPGESRASTFAVAVTSVNLVSLLTRLCGNFAAVPGWFQMTLLGAVALQYVLCFFFIKRVAEFVRDEKVITLTRSAVKWLIIAAGWIATYATLLFGFPAVLTQISSFLFQNAGMLGGAIFAGAPLIVTVILVGKPANNYEKALRALRRRLAGLDGQTSARDRRLPIGGSRGAEDGQS